MRRPVNINLDPKTIEDVKRMASEKRVSVSAFIEALILREGEREALKAEKRATR